jgi:hypothetical protein
MIGLKIVPLLSIFYFIAVSHEAAFGASAIVEGNTECWSAGCDLKNAKITGVIDASTVDKVKRIVDETLRLADREKKAASFSWSVELDSPGGSVTAAMAIGRLFRKNRVWVIVPHWAVCHSACVLIYAGAVRRMTAGKIGIHRPYFEVPRQEVSSENVKELYQRMLQDIRSYFREMNVSEQLADAMLRIEPQNVRLLNETALNSYGLTDTDPIEDETFDLEMAQMYGLEKIARRTHMYKIVDHVRLSRKYHENGYSRS